MLHLRVCVKCQREIAISAQTIHSLLIQNIIKLIRTTFSFLDYWIVGIICYTFRMIDIGVTVGK